MRGTFLHNKVLVGLIAACLIELGARIWLEHRVTGGCSGAVDLYAELAGMKIVCEAELRPARLRKDIQKALALEADLLLIAVPNAKVAKLMQPQIAQASIELNVTAMEVWCLPLGVALQRLTCFCQSRMSRGH